MQVRAKTTDLINYKGHIFNLDTSTVYDGEFADWLHAQGHKLEVVEGEPIEAAQAAPQAKAPTVAELRQAAADLGINPKGLKKPELAAAIEAAQAASQKAEPAAEAVTEPAEQESETTEDVDGDSHAG
jgi:hypothetical protein